MDSKNEVKVDDYVMYEDGSIVLGKDDKPVKVVQITNYFGRECVFYQDGGYDFLHTVRKCHSLLLELI
jgi:hypothetical protein